MGNTLSKLQILIFFFICVQCDIHSQSLPENGHVFLQDEVARVDIIIHPDSFELMLNDIDYGSTHEFQSTFIYTTSFSSDTLDNIGFRLRGNTSLQSAKKSFKVSFNTFQSGNAYHGLEKLNLNGEHNDVSIMRSKLSWEMIRNAGLHGSRTSYVELYVNEEYRGLYINVEHYDEEFIKKYKGQKVGNLYKCLWPATLEYISDNPNSYKLELNGRRVYDLKTNKGEDDYINFAHFIDVLNNADDASFACEIEKIFNVDDYLKYAAIDVLIGNWDGYIVNKNNFYLYENKITGQMEYFPYDLDNTWGIDWFGIDWSTTSLYNWNFEDRPLYERLLEVPRFREQYSFYLDKLLQTAFSYQQIESRWPEEIRDLISSYVENDPFYPLDYGFDHQDFMNSFDNSWGAHIPIGLADYVNARSSYVMANLSSFEEPLETVAVYDSIIDIETRKIIVETKGEVDSVLLDIYENSLQVGHFEMISNGEGKFSYTYSSGQDLFEYQCVIYGNGEYEEVPCGLSLVWTSESDIALHINELMSLNTSTVADNTGQFEDWIELYNSDVQTIDMRDIYLSDDLCDPLKWRLPEQDILNGEFKLFWADDDPEQGGFHANFRLNSLGECVYLFTKELSSIRLVDSICFPELTANAAYGRIEDGIGSWDYMNEPTPSSTNTPSFANEVHSDFFYVFPNPASDRIYFNAPINSSVHIFNNLGQKVYSEESLRTNIIEVGNWPPGMYFVHFTGQGRVEKVTFIKE